MLYRFCSKFRALSTSAKILKVRDSVKVGNFLRHSVLNTDVLISPSSTIL